MFILRRLMDIARVIRIITNRRKRKHRQGTQEAKTRACHPTMYVSGRLVRRNQRQGKGGWTHHTILPQSNGRTYFECVGVFSSINYCMLDWLHRIRVCSSRLTAFYSSDTMLFEVHVRSIVD